MLTKQDLKNIGDLIEIKLKPLHRDIKTINKNMERDFGFHEKNHIHVAENVQQIQRNLGIPIMTIEAPEINNF